MDKADTRQAVIGRSVITVDHWASDAWRVGLGALRERHVSFGRTFGHVGGRFGRPKVAPQAESWAIFDSYL